MLKEKISKKNKIGAAIIGLGNIGLLYDLNTNQILTHSKSLIKNPKVKLMFAIDRSLKNRKIFEQKYKIKTYKSLKDISEFDKIKLLVVSTPTKTHLNIIKTIPKKNKLKYIILEKPGGRNYNELLKVYNFCKKNKINLSINYFRNYLNQFNNLKKLFISKKQKKIIFWYSKGMLNNCSHLINFSLSIFGWPKKITTLGNYSKFSKEKDFDFKIDYKNSEIYFLCTPKKNISHNEIIFLSEDVKLFSKNDFNEVFKQRFNKNFNFTKKSVIAKSPSNLQSEVLKNKLIMYKDKRKILKNIKVNLMTLKLIDYVKNKKNYKL